MFGLVDCNNFYVSCERVFRPDLNRKPVVVLSNNDGCVISRSNEAKAIGVPMGAPAFKFKDLIEKHNIVVFSSNFKLYGDLSSRVMTILAQMSPEIEIYSIDEAFIRFTNAPFTNLEDFGRNIRQTILRNIGLPVSVGFANTKSLAKVATHIAKKFPLQTGNVYIIDSEEKRIKALKWLSVEDIWGIGRQISKRMYSLGIKKAIQFTQLPDSWIKKNLSIVQLKLKKDLCGTPTLQLEDIADKKSIATTRSFDKEYTELEQLRERVVTFASACAYKLRKQKSLCQTIVVFIHTNFYKDKEPQYSQSIAFKLPFPTNSTIELAKFASIALIKIFKSGFKYKKAGVIVSNFIPQNYFQLSIFQNSDPRHTKLMKAMDKINERFGSHKVHLAAQQSQRWIMNQTQLSPNYTTKIDEIITVKAT